MKPRFELVDAGCLMFDSIEGRWIIEHPKNGYMPTVSKLWDVIIEHPENPHREPLKFLGSFKTKKDSIEFITRQLESGVDYFNAEQSESKFYNKDYSHK